ncbi:unnamed protein product [Rhizophagus irregularis]|nr:unnamed protein product [Rhizophagus irregularis]CAB4442901.1 unnamed protein product [Rhizophagus irregularis]
MINKRNDSEKKQGNSAFDRNQNIERRERNGNSIIKKKRRKNIRRSKNKRQKDINRVIEYRQKQSKLMAYINDNSQNENKDDKDDKDDQSTFDNINKGSEVEEVNPENININSDLHRELSNVKAHNLSLWSKMPNVLNDMDIYEINSRITLTYFKSNLEVNMVFML